MTTENGLMSIRLPKGVKKRIETLAEVRGITPSGAARELLEQALTRQDLTVALHRLEQRVDLSIEAAARAIYMIGILVKSDLDADRREELFAGLMNKAEAYAKQLVEDIRKGR